MWLNRTSEPAATPVSLDEAKAHLRVLHGVEDDVITALIAAATQMLDGRNGVLGRALVTQSWEYRIDAFPRCGLIELPLPPLLSVESVKYIDEDGAEQTLAASEYVVDVATMRGQVRLGYGKVWPATQPFTAAVRIAFTAGFGADEDVPRPVRQAILLMVGHWYANRETVSEANLSEVPMAAKWLLGPYKLQAV